MGEIQRARGSVIVRLSSLANNGSERSLLGNSVLRVIELREDGGPVVESVVYAHIRHLGIVAEGNVQIEIVDKPGPIRAWNVRQQLCGDRMESGRRNLVIRERQASSAIGVARGRIEQGQAGHVAEVTSEPGSDGKRCDG